MPCIGFHLKKHLQNDYQQFYYFDDDGNLKSTFCDGWPHLKPFSTDDELILKAICLLLNIQALVKKESTININRSDVSKDSLQIAPRAANLTELLILLHQHNYIFFKLGGVSNRKRLIILNPKVFENEKLI